ncbi:unnamed protein product, partial [Discosporangium mesarthrocarpum]
SGTQSEFPCFTKFGASSLEGFKARLMLDATDDQVVQKARALVERSENHFGTWFYDKFQLWTNGILP